MDFTSRYTTPNGVELHVIGTAEKLLLSINGSAFCLTSSTLVRAEGERQAAALAADLQRWVTEAAAVRLNLKAGYR
ncbi:hypothetical protein [Amycolatopsis minnesotensis]|uniref:Uncharacterized protein n=1 Tax=Amycolatopsis minnesotensis TaxID=337894 RepID=A0ABN2SAP7_9PSEU